jgi:hypothetical protein
MNLTKSSLLFDYCFVCEVRFKTSKPPGPLNREDHHIFPRNAGGTDGPEVSLCSEHHGTIHKIANRVKAGKPYHDLLVGETQHKKLLWLAHCIVKAEKLTEADPNKTYRNGIALSSTELEMIKRLQAVYPGKTRQEILRYALTTLYRKHHP